MSSLIFACSPKEDASISDTISATTHRSNEILPSGFLEWLAKKRVSNQTKSHYRWAARKFIQWLDNTKRQSFSPDQITAQSLQSYRESLQFVPGLSTSQVKNRMFGARGLARWAFESGIIELDPLEEVFPHDINAFIKWISQKGMGRASIRVYTSRIRSFARWVEDRSGRQLSSEDLSWVDFFSYWREADHSSSTRDGHICALRYYTIWKQIQGELPRKMMRGSIGSEIEKEFLDWLSSRGMNRGRAESCRRAASRFYLWFVERRLEEPSPETYEDKDLFKYIMTLRKDFALSEITVRFHKNAIERYLIWTGIRDTGPPRTPLIEISDNIRRSLDQRMDNLKARALLQLADGEKVVNVARSSGVSRWTVYKWAKQLWEAVPSQVDYFPKES